MDLIFRGDILNNISKYCIMEIPNLSHISTESTVRKKLNYKKNALEYKTPNNFISLEIFYINSFPIVFVFLIQNLIKFICSFRFFTYGAIYHICLKILVSPNANIFP